MAADLLHRWRQAAILGSKDMRSVQPLIAGAWLGWLGCVVSVAVLPQLGLRSELAGGMCFALIVACGYFGVIKCTVLDYPWDPMGFTSSKPVCPTFAFVAKALVLLVVFLSPALVAPRFGGMVGTEIKAILTGTALTLFIMVSALLARYGLLAVGMHLVLAKAVVSVALNRAILVPRWGDWAAFTLLNLGFAVTLLSLAAIRHRAVALVVGFAMLVIIVAASFRVQPF